MTKLAAGIYWARRTMASPVRPVEYLPKPNKWSYLGGYGPAPAVVIGPARAPDMAYLMAGDTFTYDPVEAVVRVNTQRVDLTPTQAALMRVLTQPPGRIVSHDRLRRTIWGRLEQDWLSTRTLQVHLTKLRAKLGGTKALHNHPGQGYRLELRRA